MCHGRVGPDAQRYRDVFGAASPRQVADEVVEADGWVRQRLVFDSRRVARAVLLALSPEVEVIDPPDVRERLVAAALALARRNGRTRGLDPAP
ncbi:MAG: WYL domain-containing protein [Chloroflexota bacterium]|nr:WYL domain-containing protein [Chloroflexota bacterium]